MVLVFASLREKEIQRHVAACVGSIRWPHSCPMATWEQKVETWGEKRGQSRGWIWTKAEEGFQKDIKSDRHVDSTRWLG